jgi:glycerophosphoryl diester phosphodiesterase
MPKRPLIIAHRGFSARYPENTLPAIHAAIHAGADMVEIDIQQTADNQLVVFHDDRLDRIYHRRLRVRDAHRSDLPAAPTLPDVLALRVPLLIEIKDADPEKVAAAVGRRRDCILFSFDPGKVERLPAHLRRYALCAGKVHLPAGVTGIGLDRRLVTRRAVIQRLHRRNLKVFVWTVNRKAEMQRLIEWGVDGLITNHPDRALAVVRNQR